MESYVKYGKRGDGKVASVSWEENILVLLMNDDLFKLT